MRAVLDNNWVVRRRRRAAKAVLDKWKARLEREKDFEGWAAPGQEPFAHEVVTILEEVVTDLKQLTKGKSPC